MNNKRLEKKIEKDIARLKKEIATLAEDSRDRFSGFVTEVGMATDKAKADISTRVEEDVSQFGTDIAKYAEKAKSNAIEAAATAKKKVENALSVYNAKAQSFVDKGPGEISEKAAQYPWVVVTIALGFGVLLGSLVNRLFRFQTRQKSF